MKSLSIALGISLVTASLAGADTLHVPSSFPTIQSAIDAAADGDTVLVANGTFTGVGNRDIRFLGKAITVRSAGGPLKTILDVQAEPTNPARGFVFDGDETRASVLEGFTIRGGATLPGAIQDTFNGGAILIQAASPTIRNCRFVDNQCGCWGAAIYSGDFKFNTQGIASPLIEGCFFENNAADDDGGGFFTWGTNLGSRPVVRNSVFLRNSARAGGGAVASFGGVDLVLDHVTMVDNTSNSGANALLVQAEVSNSIFWSANGSGLQEFLPLGTITFSLVPGGRTGLGNVDVEPRFAADGYHLLPNAPLIHAGQNLGGDVGGLDIDGQPRRLGVRTDIGADESERWIASLPQVGPTQR